MKENLECNPQPILEIAIKKRPPIANGKDPILGHLWKFKRDTYYFLKENCNSKGPIYSFQIMSRHFYVLNHPDFIRHVLVTNAKNYIRNYEFLAMILGQGLLTTEGEKWSKRRKMVQPAFYKDKLENLILQMETSINDFIATLVNQPSKRIDLEKEMNHLAINILTNSIIQVNLEQHIPLIKQNLLYALTYVSNIRYNAFNWNKFLPSKRKYYGIKGIKSLKNIVSNIIRSRRNSNQNYSDLLSLLMDSTDGETNLKLSDEELLDEVMTLFIAGHETISVVLTWAFYLIAQHPEIENNIIKEINEYDKGEFHTMKDLEHYQYLKMVILEVMRLYPPVWTIGRTAIDDDEICGFIVPAKMYCTMPTLFIHRNSEFWEKPNDFYPEHFLPEKIKARNKYAYFPFGSGHHLCIGEHYAIMEIQLVLIHVFRKYKIRLISDKNINAQLLITLKPKDLIHVIFDNRT